MTMRHLEGEFRRRGDRDFAEIVSILQDAFNERNGQPDVDLPKTRREVPQRASRVQETQKPVEIDLNAEWQRQAGRYVALGFHNKLSLSEEDYLASLPKFEPQPESFAGRFDIPVLVQRKLKKGAHPMSRSSMDFDFRGCSGKPCGKDRNSSEPDPQKPCVGTECRLYKLCDLEDKKFPWEEPVARGPIRLAV